MNELPAVRKEISRLQIGADDPIVDPGQIAPSTAHDLYTVASITSTADRRLAAAIVEVADEIGTIGARCDWHGTPQPTLDERRIHGPEQQLAVARLSEKTAAYEQWLERCLRFGRQASPATPTMTGPRLDDPRGGMLLRLVPAAATTRSHDESDPPGRGSERNGPGPGRVSAAGPLPNLRRAVPVMRVDAERV
jgi:hypothetical protein